MGRHGGAAREDPHVVYLTKSNVGARPDHSILIVVIDDDPVRSIEVTAECDRQFSGGSGIRHNGSSVGDVELTIDSSSVASVLDQHTAIVFQGVVGSSAIAVVLESDVRGWGCGNFVPNAKVVGHIEGSGDGGE